MGSGVHFSQQAVLSASVRRQAGGSGTHKEKGDQPADR